MVSTPTRHRTALSTNIIIHTLQYSDASQDPCLATKSVCVARWTDGRYSAHVCVCVCSRAVRSMGDLEDMPPYRAQEIREQNKVCLCVLHSCVAQLTQVRQCVVLNPQMCMCVTCVCVSVCVCVTCVCSPRSGSVLSFIHNRWSAAVRLRANTRSEIPTLVSPVIYTHTHTHILMTCARGPSSVHPRHVGT